MLSLFVLLVAAFHSALAENITVTDPVGAVQCLPYTFSWSGGIPPYIVLVQSPSYNELVPDIQTFNDVNGTSITWNQTQGFTGPVLFTLAVLDSTDALGTSAQETLAVGDVAVDEAGNCLNNATQSATAQTGTDFPPFRTSTPGGPQSGFSKTTIALGGTTNNVGTTIVPTAASTNATPGAQQTGAAMPDQRISFGGLMILGM
ncbi:hypothetical protein B0H11DRAFT_517521 [Mycena galericulata]|nr:hypothetical protein B0H11DRAFT_517521 [Mycena galericulata]